MKTNSLPSLRLFFFALLASCFGLLSTFSKQRHTSVLAAAFPAIPASPLAGQDPDEFEVKITFRAAVDKLRLRAEPKPDAAVLCEIPENSRLEYLHQSGGQVMEATLRGKRQKGRWHKLRYHPEGSKPIEGWAFAGGLALENVSHYDVPLAKLNYDFLKVQEVKKAEFEAQAARYKNDFVDDAAARAWADTAVLLTFDNGQSRVVADSVCSWYNAQTLDQNNYVGQYPGVGLYLMYGECEHAEIFGQWYNLISKRDGTTYSCGLNGEIIPALSPDNKWLVDSFSADCGSIMGLNFVVNDGKTWRHAFMLETAGEMAEQIVWGRQPNEVWVEWKAIEDNVPTRYYKINFEWP